LNGGNERMEARDNMFSIVMIGIMVISAFVLTYKWMTRFASSNYSADAVIVLAAMVLIGALAAMILSIDLRIRKIESMIEAKERSLRINIQSVEENVDHKLNVVLNKANNNMDEMSRRMYK
jgi:formate hydrogenlyase subunit 3/multisubunit Na+/H+ antiporter MnhD subunit